MRLMNILCMTMLIVIGALGCSSGGDDDDSDEQDFLDDDGVAGDDAADDDQDDDLADDDAGDDDATDDDTTDDDVDDDVDDDADDDTGDDDDVDDDTTPDTTTTTSIEPTTTTIATTTTTVEPTTTTTTTTSTTTTTMEDAELSGAFEKGPFITGSSISISAIDESGNPTGQVFNTQTLNYLGEFVVTLHYRGYISLDGTGIYYNEITGGLSDTSITLQAYHKILGGGLQHAYVNLITHLTYNRVQTLIGQGMDIGPAIAQAEEELRTTIQIGLEGFDPGEDGIDMNILGGDTDANAYLFAVASVLAQVAWTRANAKGADSELQNLLNTISDDLMPDGALNQDVINEIHDAQIDLDADQVMTDLADYLESLGSDSDVPDLNRILDQDFDGLVNADDNCPFAYNPDQTDTDMNGIGDACECGNNFTDPGEQCDDGNPINGDGCDTDCTWSCTLDDECIDDVFCNGTETCVDHLCTAGTTPCPDDGLWCNGTESCDEINLACLNSGNPCPSEPACSTAKPCDEPTDTCAWVDPDTCKMWQREPLSSKKAWSAAKTYCSDLVYGGYSSWRLPTISELRMLIHGCIDTEPGGDCEVTDTCLGLNCWLAGNCDGCTLTEGPNNGCYGPDELGHECDYFWSSSGVSGTGNAFAWSVSYNAGSIDSDGVDHANLARCIRP